MIDQPNLFASDESAAHVPMPAPSLPAGFKYQRELIMHDEQRELIHHILPLPLKEFEFHGYTGKRRVVSFGWRYDFNDRKLQKADDMPAFQLPLRRRAAEFAGLGAESLQHVLVTEYSPGSASAGTETKRSSPKWSESRCSRRVVFGCDARLARSGNARRLWLNHGPPICSRVQLARNGNTASRRSSSCDTRSRSAISAGAVELVTARVMMRECRRSKHFNFSISESDVSSARR